MEYLFDFLQIEGGELDPKYVISTRIRTGRSIRGFCLPPMCTRSERRKVEKIVELALDEMPEDFQGSYFPLATMTDAEQEQLIKVGM